VSICAPKIRHNWPARSFETRWELVGKKPVANKRDSNPRLHSVFELSGPSQVQTAMGVEILSSLSLRFSFYEWHTLSVNIYQLNISK